MKVMRRCERIRDGSTSRPCSAARTAITDPVAISGSIIYEKDGTTPAGSIGFARDIRMMRHREQLATAGEIAVRLAHEIYNPLEAITNNLDLLARCVEAHLSDAELVVEHERLDSIRTGIRRVQSIVRRLDKMTRKGIYETRDYLASKKMADLAPRGAEAEERALESDVSRTDATGRWRMAVLVARRRPRSSSLADVARRAMPELRRFTSTAFGIPQRARRRGYSDVVMPEMDGYEFYTRIKERMPVAANPSSTGVRATVLMRSRLKGLEGALFKKPVNPARLRDLLIRARQKGPGQPAKALPFT
jgi:CheY-like chemotaxis protein